MFLVFEFVYGTPPSCLKVRGWVVVVVVVVGGGLELFSVSPRPLGFGSLGFWVWGLGVWCLGLTISIIKPARWLFQGEERFYHFDIFAHVAGKTMWLLSPKLLFWAFAAGRSKGILTGKIIIWRDKYLAKVVPTIVIRSAGNLLGSFYFLQVANRLMYTVTAKIPINR